MTESVWEYPRPPKLDHLSRRARVVLIDNGVTIADSMDCIRYLERSHPPTIYFPAEHVDFGWLTREAQRSAHFCEWKGIASTYNVGGYAQSAWSYNSPLSRYVELAGYIAFWPRVWFDCFVDDYEVIPQPGSYYGGWIYPGITGPFKGDPLVQRW